MLNSFPDQMTTAIFGANGGIGRAFLSHLLSSGKCRRIYAFSRSPEAIQSDQNVAPNKAELIPHYASFDEPETIKAAAEAIKEPINLLIIATGLLHEDTGHGEQPSLWPEKDWADLDAATLARNFEINSIGPALILRHFLLRLARDQKAVAAALSARIGSISDNRIGGWYGYRASKAALNMLIKSSAIELKRKNKNASLIALHPGTVDTSLSAPFQKGLRDGQLQTATIATAKMLTVINQTTPENSGKLYAYDGTEITP